VHPYSIARTIGVFSMIFGFTLLVPMALAIGYGETQELINFLKPFGGSLLLGGTLWLIGRREPANLGTRDGFLIVMLF
jgi:trk system potassium uptake protein